MVDLWDNLKQVEPPVAENVLCMERHLQRMKFFCIPEKKSSEPNTSKEKSSSLCPVMLMKNNVRESAIARWSIILPLSWLKVFWDAAVSAGAQAIGLKERRWIACDRSVFQEGALVCAPHFSDISLWKNSTEDDEGKLQIPDSLLRTYFVQRKSDNWELKGPEASEAAREFYGKPIGFITSGFVRGRKKPIVQYSREERKFMYWEEIEGQRLTGLL